MLTRTPGSAPTRSTCCFSHVLTAPDGSAATFPEDKLNQLIDNQRRNPASRRQLQRHRATTRERAKPFSNGPVSQVGCVKYRSGPEFSKLVFLKPLVVELRETCVLFITASTWDIFFHNLPNKQQTFLCKPKQVVLWNWQRSKQSLILSLINNYRMHELIIQRLNSK